MGTGCKGGSCRVWALQGWGLKVRWRLQYGIQGIG